MILQLAIEETWIDHLGLLDCTSWPPGLNVSDTWIGRLGDLGRYRMAIQEEDPKTRNFPNPAAHVIMQNTSTFGD
jgi:hypothetical protein